MTKRSTTDDSPAPPNHEAKRTKMDEPPASCLRTRRTRNNGRGAFPSRGRGGRGSMKDSESRLGSLSACQLPDDKVAIKTEETSMAAVRDQLQPKDVTKKEIEAVPESKGKVTKSPKQLVNEYYAKLQVKSAKNQYTTIKHEKVNKFVSVFTCPLSGEHFTSGRLRGEEFLEEDGLVWYPNTKLAMTAAAARAMDCFHLRKFKKLLIQNNVPQYTCLDDPYLKNDGPVLPTGFKEKLAVLTSEGGYTSKNQIVKEEQSTDQMCLQSIEQSEQKVVSKAETAPTINQSGEHSEQKHASVLKSPKQLLNEHYAKQHINAIKNQYTSVRHDTMLKFTCVFTCPTSGERFMCGRLKGEEFSEENGIIWYASLKSATTAVAARAIDCFAFREHTQNDSGKSGLPQFLCLEEPYTKNTRPDFPEWLKNKLLKVMDVDTAGMVNDDSPLIAAETTHTKDEQESVTPQVIQTNNKPVTNPTKSPKQLLNEHYAKLQIQSNKDNYTSIMHDKVQLVKFASVFTCPIAGEHFVGGRLKGEGFLDEEELVWYANTKLATTAAAARALDCFKFRSLLDYKPGTEYLCSDEPYMKNSGPALPNCFKGKLPINNSSTVDESCNVTNEKHVAKAEPNQDLDQTQTNQQPCNPCPINQSVQIKAQPAEKFEETNEKKLKIKRPASDPLPRQEIQQHYIKVIDQSQMSKLKNYYVVWSHQFLKKVRYTSIFTCPLTLESFPCGQLSENNEEAMFHQSYFWYQTKNGAKDAAAAKALDCFAYRECVGSNETPKKRCLDTPYFKEDNWLPPTTLPDGVTLPTTILTTKTEPSADRSMGPNPAPTNEVVTGTPKQILNSWYSAYWKRIKKTSFRLSHPSIKMRKPDKDSYITWTNLGARGNTTMRLFTAVFVCPWTGERFLSGKLVDKQMQFMEQYFDLGVEGSDEGVETRPLIWYRSKKDAENAAAGRALDCYLFRFTSRNSAPVLNTSKYCSEPPYEANEMDIVQRLTGVLEVYNDMSRPIYFKLPWKVVPIEERMKISY